LTEHGFHEHVQRLAGKSQGLPWGTVVWKDGDALLEAHGDGGSANSKWEIGSIRKSVCSTLLGAAIEEGRIRLDTAVHEVWPEIVKLGSEKDRSILVRHLATNTSGWMLDHSAGEKWVYNNAACTAGNVLVGRAYEMPDDRIAPLVSERIASAIGADWDCYHYEESFESGKHGQPGPKLAIDSTLPDLVKFGRLWLNEGQWNGQSLAPVEYVREARSNQCAHLDAHYGYWWFTNDGRSSLPEVPEDAYFHIGHGREHRRTLFICVPSESLVVAIGTHQEAFDISDLEQARSVISPLFG
jgi:CubicO group peptidase (beta-lactamase class C family)